MELCVNITSKEFKDKAKLLNVSENALERIIDTYYDEVGSAEAFPTDSYIEALFSPVNIVEQDELNDAHTVWEEVQKENLNFSTLQEAEQRKQELTANFDESDMVVKPLNDGTFDLIVGEPIMLTPIKPEYKGKLIFAQSGTGKSTIADNISVLDADYIWGKILGVSPQFANMVYQSLSQSDRNLYYKQFMDKIHEALTQGKTVLTTSIPMMKEASIVIHNESIDLTNQRTISEERRGANKMASTSFQEDIMEAISLIQPEENKQIISLNSTQYLADILLTNPKYKVKLTKDKNTLSLHDTCVRFLNNFGISVRDIANYQGEEDLFDALNRVVNASSDTQLSEATGYAVAFMMQYHPRVRELVSMLHAPGKSVRRAFHRQGNVQFTMSDDLYSKINRTPYLKEIGKDIANELNKLHGKQDTKTSDNWLQLIWEAIKAFFDIMNPRAKEDLYRISSITSQIAEAINTNQVAIVSPVSSKPGTKTYRMEDMPTRVDLQLALKDNSYEESIVTIMNRYNISLAGGASIASLGSLYRTKENPLHDLDLNAVGHTRESIELILKDNYPYFEHTTTITDKEGKDKTTETYLILDRPFEQRRDIKVEKEDGTTETIFGVYDKSTGELLATRKNSDLEIKKKEVQGKMLDFFIGKENKLFENVTLNYNGKNYLVANQKNAMDFKVRIAREKDIWDYSRFIPDNVFYEHETNLTNALGDFRLDKLIGKATIEDLLNIVNQSQYKDVLDAIKSIVGDKAFEGLKVSVTFSNRNFPNQKKRAYYDARDKHLYINAGGIYTNGDASSVIMHELMHYLTVEKLAADDKAREAFLDIINEYNENIERAYLYIGENALEEFVADVWSNANTIEKLKNIQSKKKVNQSLWQRIKNFFNSLFFKSNVENSLFERASTGIAYLLELTSTKQVSGIFFENEHLNNSPQAEAIKTFTDTQRVINSSIKFNKATHTYTVKGKQADYSVTELKEFVLTGKVKEGTNTWLEVASRIGTSHDEVLRDYFLGKVKDSYPNLNKSLIEALQKEAARLKRTLLNKLGKDVVFITDESLLKVAGTILYKGETYTVAGTMDMVAIDTEGNIHIVDFKTKRANSTEELDDKKLEEYDIQLSLYKSLLESHPNFNKKVSSTRIALFNVKYAAPKEVEYEFNRGLVKVNGENIQDSATYSVGTLHRSIPRNVGREFLEDYEITKPTSITTTLQQLAISKKELGWATGVSKRDLADVTVGRLTPEYAQLFDVEIQGLGKVHFYSIEHYIEFLKARTFRNNHLVNILKNPSYTKSAKLAWHKVQEHSNYTEKQEQEWAKKYEFNVTRKAIREALELNPSSKELLMNTGSAELINTKSDYSRFSEALMKVREEFGGTGIPEGVEKERLLAQAHRERTLKESATLQRQSSQSLAQKTGEISAKDSLAEAEVSQEQKIAEAEAALNRAKKVEEVKHNTNLELFWDNVLDLQPDSETPEGLVASYTLDLINETTSYTDDEGKVVAERYTDITDGSKDRKIALIPRSMEYSSILHINSTPVNNNFLYTLDSLIRNVQLYPVYGERIYEFEADDTRADYCKELKRENKEFPYFEVKNKETKEVKKFIKIPDFTVGYTALEIRERNSMNLLLDNELLTQEELRTLSKAAMYKLSEFITMIHDNTNGYEYFFRTDDESWSKDKNKDVDFTKLNRIEIIKKIGIKNLLTLVRDRVFDSELRNQDGTMSESTLDKLDVIYENWEAFCNLGYDTLIGLEEIALDEKDNVKTLLDDLFDDKTEQEIQEIFGSSIEHWLVGFRLVSAFNSLSLMIKRTIDGLYQLDAEGNQIIDEFGLAKHLDPQESVAKILYYTQGSRSIDDMIKLLKERATEEAWLDLVIALLEDLYDTEGKLISKADELFRSLFYSNFQKYFLKYAIIIEVLDKKDKNKKSVQMKIINESLYSEVVLNESKAKENSFATGAFKLKTKEGKINQENLAKLKELQSTLGKMKADVIKYGKEGWSKINLAEYHKTLKEIFDLLDISTPEDESLYRLFGVKKNLETLNTKLSFLIRNIKEGKNITDIDEYKKIVELVAKEMGLEMESVSYEAGKMYYSYVLPSYLGRLVLSLNKSNLTDEEYEHFLLREYLQYPWFFKDGKIRLQWLRRLKGSKEARANFQHVTQLLALGKEYSDKTPAEYIASMMRMYFYDNNKQWAYYRVPMMSNKPSEEYIKFYRISKEQVELDMWDVFLQELDRIQAVRERKNSTNSDLKIANFDKNGEQFLFADYLLPYLDGTFEDKEDEEAIKFHELLNKKLDGKMSEESNDNAELMRLFNIFTHRGFEENYQKARQLWIDEGFITLKEDGTIDKVFLDLKLTEDDLRDFFWNDTFAATLILQLTITDLAYYKDTEDLLKRLAQLHAPGSQPNVIAKDFDGIMYSAEEKDGRHYERTMYIKDSLIESEIIPNLKLAFKKLINEATSDLEKANLRALRDSIIKSFEEVNEADAQGYSCPTSFRKKMGVFGLWDARMEEAYRKIVEKKDTSVAELIDVFWQPLKPFVYSLIKKDGHNTNLDILKVGVQNKNSEYTLILADAIMKRAGVKSNKLEAIYKFMESTQGHYNADGTFVPEGRGIDTIQFESTVKAGKCGVIDLTGDLTEDEVFERLSVGLLKEDGTYDSDYVHEIPFEDYMIQQNVPHHFRGHKLAHGSLDRILTFADMLDVNPNTGETNYLVVDGVRKTVAQAKKDYFDAIAKNIEESKLKLIDRFNLNELDLRAKNVAISRMLKDVILRDSRYGSDLLWACDTNEQGEFNIPLSDPIQSNRIQLLLNSIIKNEINKQEIAGGPVVQVTQWGMSDELHIRFKDSYGDLLFTKNEFDLYRETGELPSDYEDSTWSKPTESETYEEYIEDQAGVAYFECYVPIQNEDIVKDFLRKNSVTGEEYIDIEAMKKANPKLLEMIGYRIPTESKYSMVPMKVKGFLPINGGEGVMLPSEITTLAGSDFDIDKLYMMCYQLFRNKDGVWEEPEEGTRAYRDNLIISTQLAVLQSELVQRLLFTPGNFEEPKKYGYLISYVQNEAQRTGRSPKEIYEEAKNWDNDTLKKKNKTSKNLIFNNVLVQFHKLNMTAAKLIGIFALANVSHAFISLVENTLLNIPVESSFKIDGKEVGGLVTIDDILTNDKSMNISNNLAALLAASVDAVKDPILNLININLNTANVVVSMLRMGMRLETVSLLVSQPIIRDLIKDYALECAEKKRTLLLAPIIDSRLEAMDSEATKVSEITIKTSDLIDNLDGHDEATNFMALSIFRRMQDIASTFRDITHMTAYNSITHAVGPFATDSMLLRMKDEAFMKNEMITPSIVEAVNNPILRAFRTSASDVERALIGENLIQGSSAFELALRDLSREMGYSKGVPDDIANAFSDFYMSYYVNANPSGPVFDLSIENRKKMIAEFPKTFSILKSKYNDNILVNSIQYVERRRNQYPTLELKTRGMSSTTIEDLKKAWVSLYNQGGSARDLAINLAEYNFFKGSFGFSPKTFINLVPNIIKANLPNYVSTLDVAMRRSLLENSEELRSRCIKLFILHETDKSKRITNWYSNPLNYNIEEQEDGTLRVERKPKEPKKKAKYTPRYISALSGFIKLGKKDVYYIVNQDLDTVILKRVNLLGNNGEGFEISLTEDFPDSVFELNVSKTKYTSGEPTVSKSSTISYQDLGVIIDNMYSEDNQLEALVNASNIRLVVTKINTDLQSLGYSLEIQKSAQLLRLAKLLIESIKGKTSIREILNSSSKTIEDLNLCS